MNEKERLFEVLKENIGKEDGISINFDYLGTVSFLIHYGNGNITIYGLEHEYEVAIKTY